MESANTSLSQVEGEILAFFLAGDDKRLRALRNQLDVCSVVSRHYTGVGFSTKLLVPLPARYPGEPNLDLTDVAGDIEGLKHGAGFILFIRDGGLHALEGYSFDELWPSETLSFKLRYWQEPRDLEPLNSLLPPAQERRSL